MTSIRQKAGKDVAYEWLKSRIVTSAIPEGSFLTEGEVATELSLSRTPVREAFLMLEAEGLLQLVPKRGAFVPTISLREIEEVMETRELVEVFTAHRALRGVEPLLPTLDALLAQQRQHAGDGDVEALIDCDRAFHLAIVRHADNSVLTRLYESMRDRQLRMGIRAATATPGRMEQVLEEHTSIVDMLRANDPNGLEQSVRGHLQRTLQTLLSRG